MTVDLEKLDEELQKAKDAVDDARTALRCAEIAYEEAVKRVKMISALISIQQGGNGNG